MSSPVVFPYIPYFKLDKTIKTPIYQQILTVFVQLIEQGILSTNFQLPSSRNMATLLTVHRKTIIKVYEHLLEEGFIYTKLNRGTFVAPIQPSNNRTSAILSSQTAISLLPDRSVNNSLIESHNNTYTIRLHNGQEGYNLMSAKTIGSAISALLHLPNGKKLLDPISDLGQTEFSAYIEEQYGINHAPKQILVSENIKTIFFHILSAFIQVDDGILLPMNAPNQINVITQRVTNKIFTYPITDTGIHFHKIEQLLINKSIKVMILYHGNCYPTNYLMSQQEKRKLLYLAHKYQCLIIEWDQQISYSSIKTNPLTAWDTKGNCVFITEFKDFTFINNPTAILIAPDNLITFLKEKDKQLNSTTMLLYRHLTEDWLSKGKHKSWIRKLHTLQKDKQFIFQSKFEVLNKVGIQLNFGAKHIWFSMPKQFQVLKWQQYLIKHQILLGEELFIENKYLKGFIMNYLDLDSLEISYIINLLLEFINQKNAS